MIRQQTWCWWVPLILLSVLAYFIQMHLYLHKDVGIITHTAALLLAGETYGNNIFEPNPPLIFYLSMPAVILAKLTTLTLLSTLRLYFIGLAFFSISCCYFLIKQLFKKNQGIIYLLAYSLAYILFFLPAQQFAQREHFLLVLILPYLFFIALRIENKPLPPFLILVISCMAGIGFAIKPHFLLALIFIEIYFIWEKRNILAWARIENAIIFTIFTTYLAAVLLFYPQYLSQVLPLWMPYYLAIAHNWASVLLYPGLLYCFTIILAYLLTAHSKAYKKTSCILLFALVGFIGAYLIPRVAWYYHILPALSVACLLAVLIFWQVDAKIIKITQGKYTLLARVSLWAMVFSIPVALSLQSTIKATLHFYAENSAKQRLIRFIQQHDRYTTFDIFAMTHDINILEYYTKATYVGSFQFFVWEYNNYLLKHQPSRQALIYQKNIPYIMDIIAHDLTDKKPQLIIVDIPSSQEYLGTKIDYIAHYSHYKNFYLAWKAYRYLTCIGRYQLYERKNA